MKQLLIKILKNIRGYIFIFLSLAISIGIIFFFRFVGLKGLMGFALGVLLTGYIFMTENPKIKAFVDYILNEF